jgi:hypothetical protein
LPVTIRGALLSGDRASSALRQAAERFGQRMQRAQVALAEDAGRPSCRDPPRRRLEAFANYV